MHYCRSTSSPPNKGEVQLGQVWVDAPFETAIDEFLCDMFARET